MEDIKFNFNKGILITNGTPTIVKDNQQYIQNIKIEAITQEGDLWHNQEFGWSLYDFLHRNIDEMLKIEITQRIRNKLANRQYVDTSSISISLDNLNDFFEIKVYFTLLNENVNFGITMDRINSEVILNG